MDENSALIEQILREDELEYRGLSRSYNKDEEWQTVSYKKRHSKQPNSDNSLPDRRPDDGATTSDVFRAIEEHSEERRRRMSVPQVATPVTGEGSKRHSDEDDDSDAEVSAAVVEVKKVKQKKPKKPKVTVSEAAARIDAGDLGAFLVDITGSYEKQEDIQLMRFADYFGRAFASVSSSQFPWLKTFRESTVAKMVDIPLSHVPEDVYKMSVDWLNQRSFDALGSFVLWSLDSILADLASHQGTGKSSKKVVQQASSKSQVAIFVVLAMVLRRKPDVLISLLPIMRENPKYQGQDKLPVTAWIIAQTAQGDLAVGLYMWVRVLLPMLSAKSSCNPQARDLILQLVERLDITEMNNLISFAPSSIIHFCVCVYICDFMAFHIANCMIIFCFFLTFLPLGEIRILSFPKARTILINGAVKKGERLVPPSALEVLMRVTFPAPSLRIKATERFEAIYPILKEVALAGSSGSKAMKQVAQHILTIAIKAAGEGIPDLSREASDIFIWALTQNPECYKQWDMLYLDNLEASIVVLRKLSDEWKEHSVKDPKGDRLRETLSSFKQKNEKELKKAEDATRIALLKDADKRRKLILRKLSQGRGCMKHMVIVSAAVAVGAVVVSQNMQSWDMKKVLEIFN